MQCLELRSNANYSKSVVDQYGIKYIHCIGFHSGCVAALNLEPKTGICLQLFSAVDGFQNYGQFEKRNETDFWFSAHL